MLVTPRLSIYCTLAIGLMAEPAAWAASFQWNVAEGHRWAELSVPAGTSNGFVLLPSSRTGVTFTNRVNEMASAANRVLLNGAGVATGDFDGDDLPDIFFCSLSGQSALFRNLGNLRFADVTGAAGVGMPGRVTRGAVFADVNGDRRLDLLVTTLAHGVACFLNQGNGKFVDGTRTAGTSFPFGSVTMALADVDGNGTLDLYVANYRSEDIRDRGQVDLHLVKGQMVVPPKLRDRLLVVAGQVLEYGEPDLLLLNDGQGRFTPQPWTGGRFRDEDDKPLAGAPLDWGLTATFRDINSDSFPDLYICNDYWTPDRIWINDGKGGFKALPRLAMRQSSSSSMGVDFADVDRDGHLDFFVTDMLSRDLDLRKRQMPPRWPVPDPKHLIEHRPQIVQNTFFHNRGDVTFEEAANYSGVAASEWSWQPLFVDIDLDGRQDLLIPSGHARDVQDMDTERMIRARQHPWTGFTNAVQKQKAYTHELMLHMRLYPPLQMPIFAFRNLGGLRFEDTTSQWGTEERGIHHSLALADFDKDGDLDFVVNNLNSRAAVYQNIGPKTRVAVRLKGLAPNTEGIGTRLELANGAVPFQSEEVICGGRYMAGSEALIVFAAGSGSTQMTLRAFWRNGKVSTIENVVPNRIYEIEEPSGQTNPSAGRAQAEDGTKFVGARGGKHSPPLFEDVTDRVKHQHVDGPFDDAARQPLLPRKLSQPGPGISWFDLNGDGWDDLLVGSGRGGQMNVFLNDQKGGFKPLQEAPFTLPITRDQTGLLGVTMADGQRRIVAGSSNYEDGLAAGSAARQFDLAHRRVDDSLPGQAASTGPVAAADFDSDGDLDLFLGGRCVPGRYPEPASSLIFRQANGRFQLDAELTRSLRNVGLVSGARWSDLNEDGWPELLLACEWGPIKVFQNDQGRLREVTSELGLNEWTGWWNGLSTGDFNGDGRMDIVAGNWGLNSPYTASPKHPLRLYYGDLAGRGMIDLLEAEFDPTLEDYAPRRRLDVLAPVFPFLLEKFPTVKEFSLATVSRVLPPGGQSHKFVEARTLASMIFLNQGNRFEAGELPREAQMAPAFAVQVADFDGNGTEDVFLSQNFFETEPEMPRLDAGRGLVLLGDGHGKWKGQPGQVSGIMVYGEQRGAAVSDYDKDGRADLVVTQNSAPTRLFRNSQAQPGLRVEVKGPTGNVHGIGTTVRLRFGDRLGPAREIHAGSGYLSQDSHVQVLSLAAQPTGLWVRWPGGKITTTPIQPAQREVTVTP